MISLPRNVWYSIAALALLALSVVVYIFVSDPAKERPSTNPAATEVAGAGAGSSGGANSSAPGQNGRTGSAPRPTGASAGPVQKNAGNQIPPQFRLPPETQQQIKDKLAVLRETFQHAKEQLAAVDPKDPDLLYVEVLKRDRMARPMQALAMANLYTDPQFGKLVQRVLADSIEFNTVRKDMQDFSTTLQLDIPFSGARDGAELIRLIEDNQKVLNNASSAISAKYQITEESRAAYQSLVSSELEIRVLTAFLDHGAPPGEPRK